MFGDAPALFRRKLFVMISGKLPRHVTAEHVYSPISNCPRRYPNLFANALCPRFRREATVPFEQPTTAAISSYESPSTYLSRMGQRSLSFSSSIAAFTHPANFLRV